MPGVTITVQNLADALVSEQEAEAIVAALDAQAKNDYGNSPWVNGGTSPEHSGTEIAAVQLIAKGEQPPARTWHLEILLNSNVEGALGYHEEHGEKVVLDAKPKKARAVHKHSKNSSRGLRGDEPSLPLMKVFAETIASDPDATLAEVCSHEMLEAAVDPEPIKKPNLARDPAQERIYIVEVGDPVQLCGYDVDGQTVADFAFPAWFGLAQSGPADQMSFRSSVTKPFKLAPGGYISYALESNENDWKQEQGSGQS